VAGTRRQMAGAMVAAARWRHRRGGRQQSRCDPHSGSRSGSSVLLAPGHAHVVVWRSRRTRNDGVDSRESQRRFCARISRRSNASWPSIRCACFRRTARSSTTPAPFSVSYIQHRHEREQQVIDALGRGDATPKRS
jgi:hypothetical protein